MSSFQFPFANQAQILRSYQRDIIHLLKLKDDTENALRSWLGTRWLAKQDKALDLLVRLIYFGLTTGQGIQTLGEEYTDVWLQSRRVGRVPPRVLRMGANLAPTICSYLLARLLDSNKVSPNWKGYLKNLPAIFDILAEINLASFYLKGRYHGIAQRIFGIQSITTLHQNPNVKPPSYGFLGVLIFIRLVYKAYQALRHASPPVSSKAPSEQVQTQSPSKNAYIDTTNINDILENPDAYLVAAQSDGSKDATLDRHTILQVGQLPQAIRNNRKCALCLEERTESTLTECGHLFCWGCIAPWAQERAECPLCRQRVECNSLLPIYNL